MVNHKATQITQCTITYTFLQQAIPIVHYEVRHTPQSNTTENETTASPPKPPLPIEYSSNIRQSSPNAENMTVETSTGRWKNHKKNDTKSPITPKNEFRTSTLLIGIDDNWNQDNREKIRSP